MLLRGDGQQCACYARSQKHKSASSFTASDKASPLGNMKLHMAETSLNYRAGRYLSQTCKTNAPSDAAQLLPAGQHARRQHSCFSILHAS